MQNSLPSGNIIQDKKQSLLYLKSEADIKKSEIEEKKKAEEEEKKFTFNIYAVWEREQKGEVNEIFKSVSIYFEDEEDVRLQFLGSSTKPEQIDGFLDFFREMKQPELTHKSDDEKNRENLSARSAPEDESIFDCVASVTDATFTDMRNKSE